MKNIFIVFVFIFIFTGCTAPTPKYDRKEWGGWSSKDCRNTRHQILKENAVKSPKLDTKKCKVTKGEWIDFYTGSKITMKDHPQIDHVVPVKHAHDFGGYNWAKEKKKLFYNDKENLVVTSRILNQKKGANDFVNWHPAERERSCLYANKWIQVKQKYELRFSRQECKNFKALEDEGPCPQPIGKVKGCA